MDPPNYEQTNFATPEAIRRQVESVRDNDHLKVLAICFYIAGALGLVGDLFIFVMVLVWIPVIGTIQDLSGPSSGGKSQTMPWPHPSIASLFTPAGLQLIWMTLLLLAFAILTFVAGRCISRRTGYGLILAISAIYLLSFPLGTALGIASLIVMTRPSVKQLFARSVDSAGPNPPESNV